MADGILTYEMVKQECYRRGMLTASIDSLTYTVCVHIHHFNLDEIMGVCLDVHSGYTLKMAIRQAKLQQAERIKNQNA